MGVGLEGEGSFFLFPFRLNPFQNGVKTIFTELPSLKLYYFALNPQMTNQDLAAKALLD